VPGLTCADGACASLVRALHDLTGVSDAFADPATDSLYVFGEGPIDLVALAEAVRGRGYDALAPTSLPLPDHGAHVDLLSDLRTSHLDPQAPDVDHARVDRIAREAALAFDALRPMRRAVAVFGSARTGPADRHGPLAQRTVEAISNAGFTVLTGGGPGLMEVASRAAWDTGGSSVGLTIELPHEQASNPWLHLDVPFRYFFLRKLAFVKYACAFVCLPGGFGTLDELFEALNLKVTHKVDPFPVILVGTHYWEGLVAWLHERVAEEGALSPSDLTTFFVTDDPDDVVDAIRRCHDTLCERAGVEVVGEDRT